MIGPYQTARDFRAALEVRLKQKAQAQRLDLMRLRREVAFDRLLARLFAMPDVPWLLKGGYTFELRLGGSARATKDIDLSIPHLYRLGIDAEDAREPNAVILERLREAVALALDDGFEFRIGEPTAELDAAPYGGARFPVDARLDNRTFAAFHLDVGIGDAVVDALEWLTGPDTLSFAGIPPARAAALSREQQFAEKLHAYTLPRGERTNTRVKDLVDLVLLLRLGPPDVDMLKLAIHATFERRATHPIPAALEPPPAHWRDTFEQLAQEVGLNVASLTDAYAEMAACWRTLGL